MSLWQHYDKVITRMQADICRLIKEKAEIEACVERDQRQSDYPHLFFVTTHPKKVDEKMRCARCGYSVGGHAASCAAKRIATMIGGENV